MRLFFDRGDCWSCSQTVFYARRGNPDAPPPELGDLTFSRGGTWCEQDCGLKPFALVAKSELFAGEEAISVAPGEPRTLGSAGKVHLHSSQRDECTDYPGTATWVAWLDLEPNNDANFVTDPDQ